MILLGLDLETTGFDFEKDHILELGMVLIDSEKPKPLVQESLFLYHKDYPIEVPAEAQAVNQIEMENVKKWGVAPTAALSLLYDICQRLPIDAIVAHNGNGFDRPMLLAKFKQYLPTALGRFEKYPWIDTRLDIEYDPKIQTRKLVHLAAEHGFLNPFPHDALSDIHTMFKILKQYNIEKVFKRSLEPTLVVRAMVSYEERQLAKDRRFQWQELDGKIYKNCWIKKIKAGDLEAETKAAIFPISIIQEG